MTEDALDGPPGGPGAATLAYGRLAIATLALVTLGSAAALTVALAVIVASPQRLVGLPYGDIAWALAAIGGAAPLACLASAAAYFAQTAGERRALRAGAALRAATSALMTVAYLAFAAGGLVFTHFCLAAAQALGRPPPHG